MTVLVGGNIDWFSHNGKQYGGYSKELPYDIAILPLGVYFEEMKL